MVVLPMATMMNPEGLSAVTQFGDVMNHRRGLGDGPGVGAVERSLLFTRISNDLEKVQLAAGMPGHCPDHEKPAVTTPS
jgi:hypothetical protein